MKEGGNKIGTDTIFREKSVQKVVELPPETLSFQLLAFLRGTRHTPGSVDPLKIEQVRGFILCKVELNKLWLSPPENQFT